MSNALESHDAKAIQRARARHLRDLFEPWTYRKLEVRTGIGRSTLQSRMTGETPMTMADFEVLAPVIRMTPEELFAELRSVGPEGLEPPTVSVKVRHLTLVPDAA